VSLKEAKQYVADAKALDVEIVCLTGGEPMLYPSLVERIISECSHLSLPKTWLFTNGFWAHDIRKAHAIVKKLKSLGLTKMFTSIDSFHQRYVPLDSVKNAIEASLQSNLKVCVDARFVGESDEENRFNLATRSHLEFLGNLLSKVGVIKGQPMFVGRAVKSLAKYVKMKPLSEILKKKCPGVWAGGTLESPVGVDVDELGFVTICPGLSIGNTREVSLRRIIEEYDYGGFVVIAALRSEGMEGLMDLASENGFIPKEVYISECHLCYDARKFLKNVFPEAFTLLT